MIKSAITDITARDGLALITADGISGEPHILSEIFRVVAGRGIDIDMITMSPGHKHRMDLSFTVSGDDLSGAMSALGELKRSIPRFMCHISGNNAKITVSGTAVSEDAKLMAEVLGIVTENNASVKLISASVNEMSLLTDESASDDIVARLKNKYTIK